MGKLAGRGQGRRRRLRMMQRPAEDLGVVVPEARGAGKGRKKKSSADGGREGTERMTKSMRRFMSGLERMDKQETTSTSKSMVEEDVTANDHRRFALVRKKNRTAATATATTTTATATTTTGGIAGANDEGDDRPKGDVQVSVHRTNRQIKRRAFEKRKKLKKRAKRLGYTDEDEDYGDDDDEELDNVLSGGKGRRRYSEQAGDARKVPSFLRVNEAPPSFALGPRGKPHARKQSFPLR